MSLAYVFPATEGVALASDELRPVAGYDLPAGNYLLTIIMRQSELATRKDTCA